MNWQRLRWKYWMDAFRRPRLDRELNDEINAHLAFEVQRRIDLGESPEEARRGALREIRSFAFVKEGTRDVWAWGALEQVAQDLGYALRILRKSPAFSAIAIVSLALGIGANTAIFSMINAVLLKPLPARNPEQLVVLTSFQRNGPVVNFAYPDYRQLRDDTQVFSGLLAASRAMPVNAGPRNRPERAQVQIVSGNYFSVLGVGARLGRVLSEEDEDSPVVVISDGYWRRTFGSDSGVLDKPLTLNGAVCRIIGVASADFFGETVGQSTDIWVSMAMQESVRPAPFDLRNVRFVSWLYLMGRLKPGATTAQAHAEMQVLVSRIHAASGVDPDDYLHHIALEPGSRGSGGLRGTFSGVLLVLMAMVAFLLLIACTNLASLLIARAASRQREVATRLALGATRLRLMRQLLTESVMLATVGGALGLAFAVWIVRVVLSLVSEGMGSITMNLYPDWRVLLFTASIAVFTGILFGLAPAIQAVRIDVGPRLKKQSQALADRVGHRRVRDLLIASQVALSLVLLAGGLLFARTLWNLKTLDTGFQPEKVLLVGIGPPPAQPGMTKSNAADSLLAARLLDRVRAIPGVRLASVSLNTPLGNAGSGVSGLQIDGYTPRNEEDQRARADWVGPDYFKTVGIPIIEGREFSVSDSLNSRTVAIVNETMARHYFGDRSAVGRRLRFNQRDFEIVGVARDAKYRDLREPAPRMLYFAFLQLPAGLNTLEVRTAGVPLESVGAVRDAISEVDAGLNIREISTFGGLIDRKLAPEYLAAGMSGFFAFLTLLLVCIGIYGTLSFTVARRTNEIGIRISLGAKPASVLFMVLRDILWPVATGLLIGVLIVLAAGPLLASLLFGLRPSDPWTIGFAVAMFTAIALAAGFFPARRASRIDPAAALRFE